MNKNSTVRFLQNSRHGDWLKGDRGVIEEELVLPPQNQFAIYIVKMNDGQKVWVTNEDIEEFNQLSLLD